jgi:glucose-6-phosphate 1-dehydrogenase
MKKPPTAPAATLVIFGALGDLTRRLLIPSLVNLANARLLNARTRILGIGHQDVDRAQFRHLLRGFVAQDSDWRKLSRNVEFLKGDFSASETFAALARQISGNAVFYLATPPDFFGPIVDSLADAGLLDETEGFRRVVVEKPFGTDLASARALNARLLGKMAENQIYRMDHYLGKETVQNILVTRFANPLIEAVWNSRYIDHVQITAAETVSVGTRGKFYDATGALRDMVPNHLFQLLALVGMEPPNSFDADAIRSEKAKLIDAIMPADPAHAARGQYDAGKVAGKAVPAYRDTRLVSRGSTTETFVALKLEIASWRWSGVPFYLRTGKALAARDTEIVIQFRDASIMLFRDAETGRLPPNRLVLQIQPNEGIRIDFAVKRPGPVFETAEVGMDFRYDDHFEIAQRTGYETLLYDVLIGDQTLFQRADQIEGGWRVVQPLLDAWRKARKPERYVAGSDGPKGAEKLLAQDGRRWNPIA